MRLRLVMLLMTCVLSLSGCNALAHIVWTAMFNATSSPFKKSEHQRRLERQREHFDALWKEGYGFNNPNPDRIRQGEDPLPFTP